jgi:selenium metabolism protein YedF
MTTTVDARGLACPQPVIQTRQAMQAAAEVVTLVDSQTSMENVSRMAQKAGWQVSVTQEANEYRLVLTQGVGPEPQPEALGRAEAIAGPLVLVIPSDTMGRGDPDLGHILIRGFFHALGEVDPRPDSILFFNTGVKLACQGSPVLEDLCALETEGVEILVCGTCLGHFELTGQLAAGQVSNMYALAETMLRAGHVVSL